MLSKKLNWIRKKNFNGNTFVNGYSELISIVLLCERREINFDFFFPVGDAFACHSEMAQWVGTVKWEILPFIRIRISQKAATEHLS